MGYRFDYLVARLTCAWCGTVAEPDERLEMTTRLRDDPQLAFLGVGDSLPVDPRRAAASGYLRTRPSADGEPVLLLHQWSCPTCGYAYNWAELTVRDGVIESIVETPLTSAAFTRAHYVVDDLREVAADLAGVRSSLDLDDEAAVRVLHDHLPADRGWQPDTGTAQP